MDIRGYCGKVARRGLHKKLEYVVNQIPKRQRTGNVMESLRSGEQKEKATKSRTHLTLSDPIAVFEVPDFKPLRIPSLARTRMVNLSTQKQVVFHFQTTKYLCLQQLM